jgi:DNA repair exonuclease SbcCD nuclease subunit
MIICLKKTGKYNFVYHIADIHIPLRSKKEEYYKVFGRLHKFIKSELEKGREGIIVICGDIFHTKDELSPDGIYLLKYLFNELLKLMPVVVIAGNHDVNMTNKRHLDSLSPLIDDMENVYYLKNTGIYKIGNIVFGVDSLIDGGTVDMELLSKEEGIKIGLYHGMVDGAKNDQGFDLNEDNTAKKRSDFDEYDIILLGDVHNMHFVRSNMAYSGSLIQQTFAETGKHGLLRWNITDKSKITVKEIEIRNDHSYHTINVNNGEYKLEELGKHPKIRLYFENTRREEMDRIEKKFRGEYNAERVECIRIEEISKSTIETLDVMRNGGGLSSKILNKYLIIIKIKEDQMKDVCKMNKEFRKDIIMEDTDPGERWRVTEMWFSNCYSYDGDWHIEFPEGILGISGLNGSGKTSIIDIMMFGLYFEHRGKGDAINIITTGKDTCKVLIEIKKGGKIYRICRMGKAEGGKRKWVHTTRFWEVNGSSIIDMTNDHRKTQKAIEYMFGGYETMQRIGLMAQSSTHKYYVDLPVPEKKIELNKMLKVNYYDEMGKKVQIMITEIKAKIKILGGMQIEDMAADVSEGIKKREQKIVENAKILKRQEKIVMKLPKNEEENAEFAQIREILGSKKPLELLELKKDELEELYAERTALREIKGSQEIIIKLERELEKARKLELGIEEIVVDDDMSKIIYKLTKLRPYIEMVNRKNELMTCMKRAIELETSIKIGKKSIHDFKDHKYDPKCKYCTSTKLVMDGKKYTDEIDDMRKELEKLLKKIDSLEGAKEELDKYARLHEELRLNQREAHSFEGTFAYIKNGCESSMVIEAKLSLERKKYAKNVRELECNIEIEAKEKDIKILKVYCKIGSNTIQNAINTYEKNKNEQVLSKEQLLRDEMKLEGIERNDREIADANKLLSNLKVYAQAIGKMEYRK